jgi:hypothetical protein
MSTGYISDAGSFDMLARSQSLACGSKELQHTHLA